MKEVVVVEWIDAQHLEMGCFTKEEIENLEPLACEVVGFKIYEDATKIILAQEFWEDTVQMKYILVIPKKSVIKITSLNETSEPKLDRHHNKCICGKVKFKTSKRCKECVAKNKYGKLSYQ